MGRRCTTRRRRRTNERLLARRNRADARRLDSRGDGLARHVRLVLLLTRAALLLVLSGSSTDWRFYRLVPPLTDASADWRFSDRDVCTRTWSWSCTFDWAAEDQLESLSASDETDLLLRVTTVCKCACACWYCELIGDALSSFDSEESRQERASRSSTACCRAVWPVAPVYMYM